MLFLDLAIISTWVSFGSSFKRKMLGEDHLNTLPLFVFVCMLIDSEELFNVLTQAVLRLLAL